MSMLNILIYVLVIAVVVGLVWWVADYLPVPQPLNKLIKIVAIVVGVIAVIYALLALPGAFPGRAL
jgi:multisubunit Na+/H+ antiporter MnhB subunit